MKKIMLAIALVTASLTAQAAQPVTPAAEDNFVHLQYTLRDTVAGDQGQTNRQGINLTLGHRFNNGLTLDIGEQFRTEKLNEDKGAGNNTTRLESGLTYTLPVNDLISVYTRGAIGYKFTANQDFTYYSVEPGVNLQATKDLSFRVGYRYRDSFSQEYFDKTNTVRVGAQYNLTKTSFVTAGVDRAYGDSQFLGINLGYGVNF